MNNEKESFKEYIIKLIEFIPNDIDKSEIIIFNFETNKHIMLIDYIRQEKLNQLGIK